MSSRPKVNQGTVCPLRCGQCCDYWRDVSRLVKECGSVGSAYRRPDCPHLGKAGCKLPRAERPIECTNYLCDTATNLINGIIDRNEAVSRKERGR